MCCSSTFFFVSYYHVAWVCVMICWILWFLHFLTSHRLHFVAIFVVILVQFVLYYGLSHYWYWITCSHILPLKFCRILRSILLAVCYIYPLPMQLVWICLTCVLFRCRYGMFFLLQWSSRWSAFVSVFGFSIMFLVLFVVVLIFHRIRYSTLMECPCTWLKFDDSKWTHSWPINLLCD